MTTVSHNKIYEDYCAYPECDCKVSREGEYCSIECEKQSDNNACSCGHPDCKPKQNNAS